MSIRCMPIQYFTQLLSEYTYLHLLKFLCECDYFSTKYGRKQTWCFFLLEPLTMERHDSITQ